MELKVWLFYKQGHAFKRPKKLQKIAFSFGGLIKIKSHWQLKKVQHYETSLFRYTFIHKAFNFW